MCEKLLRIGIGNAKLKNDVAIFDLPAGHTCPFAKDCAEKVDPITGKLIVNPTAKFRCFAATSELISPAARVKRWHNFDLLKEARTSQKMAELIIDSINGDKLAKNAPKMRIHSSGDFFNQAYFNAWLLVAQAMPEKIFYAYTKSVKLWVNRLDEIPTNLHLTASLGGKNDELIHIHNLKHVEIVFSVEEAIEKNIEIDHDDSHCYNRNVTKFALLIHGTQIAGSEAMKAVSELRKNGIMGYDNKKVGKGRKVA
jgi:hypothetical protein